MQVNEDGHIEIDRHMTHNLVLRCKDKCTICLGAFGETPIHTLQCGHAYHTTCVVTWFRAGNPSCPLCRDEEENIIVSPPEAVRRLKKIAKRKSAPTRLKKCVTRLKKAEEEHTQAKRSLRDFEKTHANVLKTVSQKRRKVNSTEKEVDKREISLILPVRPYKGVELPLIIFPAEDEQADSFELHGFF